MSKPRSVLDKTRQFYRRTEKNKASFIGRTGYGVLRAGGCGQTYLWLIEPPKRAMLSANGAASLVLMRTAPVIEHDATSNPEAHRISPLALSLGSLFVLCALEDGTAELRSATHQSG